MLFPLSFMDSTCTIQRRYRKQKLTYTGGTGTPVVGQTVTGGTSHETAEITKVGTGYIVVKDLSGMFTIGETLTTTTLSGTLSVQADYLNQSNEYEYYWLDDQVDVPCRFGYSRRDSESAMIHETGQLLDQPVKVALPDTITLVGTQGDWAANYRISSIADGFYGVFQIMTPYVSKGISGIDHYSLILKVVP